MSGKLPILSSKEVISILNKLGFEVIRQKGSHLFLRHGDGRCTVVPVHANKDIGRGLLKRILDEISMPRDEFLKLVK
ncbi:MAG: hypothetical protein A2Z88_00455 [Omnitrophica WOR_2 bacterium GWA2_47_8]|nr:MAG: hypothetical protein A2Z88_00455 [Omnitrophica WOR_2 bacterium GWA2_47_8]